MVAEGVRVVETDSHHEHGETPADTAEESDLPELNQAILSLHMKEKEKE